MSRAETVAEIKSWSAEDRLELIDQLWMSLEDEPFVPDLTDDLKAELERRRDAVMAHPERSRSWDGSNSIADSVMNWNDCGTTRIPRSSSERSFCHDAR